LLATSGILRLFCRLSRAFALSGCAGPIVYSDDSPVKIGETLYADPAIVRFEHSGLVAMMANAKRRIVGFYGEQRSSDPDVIFCRTSDCSVYFSGTEKRSRAISPGRTGPGGSYRARRPTVVIVSSGNNAENVLTHELSHIEHRARFGTGRAPSWFHEGVAVYVSGEPDCNGVFAKGIDDLSKLSYGNSWDVYTNDRSRIRQTYCQAAHEIRSWVLKSGKPALLNLMDDVKAGKPFDSAFGPLIK